MPVETDIKILLRNIGVVVLELRHVAESGAGQAVGLAELPEALLLEKAGLVAPAGQGDEHPFVRRAVVVLVAHDVGQTLVLHQDTDALKDGGDLLRALGLIAGEHVELGGLVGVSPPNFQAAHHLFGLVDVVEGEDIIPVILHVRQPPGLLLGHQTYIQALAELKAAAGFIQLVQHLLPLGKAEKLVVPQVYVLAGGVEELLHRRVAEHMVILLVDTEGALAEAAPSGKADAVVHVVAVGLGLDAPGDLPAHIFVVEVVVGHMVFDLQGKVRGGHPEKAGASNVQIGVVLGINGYVGKIKYPGEIYLVVFGNGVVILQQGDVVAQLLLIAADFHESQVGVTGPVIEQIRVDNSDCLGHVFTVLPTQYSKSRSTCQSGISLDHFKNDPKRSKRKWSGL